MKEPRVEIWNEDCITGLAKRVPDNSVHLTVTSIPFEELFTYSGKTEDVGNNGSTVDCRAGRFALNMRFVVQQLFRATAPGCNVCIHIQQLLAYKNQHGFSGRRDFRGAMIDVFTVAGEIAAHEITADGDVLPYVVPALEGDGFRFIGEVAIPKDPQRMARDLNLHSLQFKTGHSRSATDWAPAPNDYVLIFQKPGEVEVPVRAMVYHDGKPAPRKDAFYEEIGEIDDVAWLAHLRSWARTHKAVNPGGWLCPADWIKWAKGDWPDIMQTDVLDGWRAARETDEEKHVCPLQLSLIRRLVLMYTNPIGIQPDVTVLDPFMGIGSVAFACIGGACNEGRIVEPRNAIGFELKGSYHGQAQRNVRKALKDLEKWLKRREKKTLLSGIEVPA